MQQQEYFSVSHQLNINVEPVAADKLPSDLDSFGLEIPEPFMLSSQQEQQDLLLLRALKQLGDAGEQLHKYLQAQAQKLDRVLSYVLLQQDNAAQRSHTVSFGGSGLRFVWSEALSVGQALRIKLFLPEESAAIYCYGKVNACHAQAGQHFIDIDYLWIREEDIELLVRASLHIQSQQLKARANARQQAE